MTLEEMRTLWSDAINQMQSLCDTAKKAKRSFTHEERKTWERLEAKERGYAEQIKRLEAGAKPNTTPADIGITPLSELSKEDRGIVCTLSNGKEIRALRRDQRVSDSLSRNNLSFGKAVKAWVTGDWSQAQEEARALSGQTGSLGGWLVPSSLSAQVIDLARSQSVCLRAGALTLPMPTPEMTIVKVASDPIAYWRGESKNITESAPTFEPIMLKAQTVGILCRIPVELIEDAPNASSLIEGLIAESIALEIDRKMLFGSGVGEIRGLSSTPNVQTVSFGDNGGTPGNYDNFSSAVEFVATENGEAKSVVFHPRTAGTLDRLKDLQNQPLVAPASYQALTKFSTSSIPVNQTQGSASNCSTAFVGDFSQMLLGVRTELTLEASRVAYDAFQKMEVLVRGYVRCDVAVLRPKHFAKLIGIKP